MSKITDIICSGAAQSTIVMLSLADLQEFAATLLSDNNKTEIVQPQDEYMTTNEIKAIYSVSDATLWRWAKMGLISCSKRGGKNIYLRSQIERVMKGQPSC